MLSTGNASTPKGDRVDFDLKTLPPKAQVMYAHLMERLWPAEQKMMLSLLKVAFYQGASAGANEIHRQAKEIFKSPQPEESA